MKKYKKDDLTVLWDSEKCIHSGICANGLSSVFKPRERPWVNMDGASLEQIKNQVHKCPSGALSIEGDTQSEKNVTMRIEFVPNGPIILHDSCNVKHSDGREETIKEKSALCRCGSSGNKPFCDGSHKKMGFEG